MKNITKKLAALLLCLALALSLCACAQTAETEAVDEYFAQLEGTYVELFPELAKEEYHDTWISDITEVAGTDGAEDISDLQRWFEGSYTYWNAAGILENYDETMMANCINLFVTENLSAE